MKRKTFISIIFIFILLILGIILILRLECKSKNIDTAVIGTPSPIASSTMAISFPVIRTIIFTQSSFLASETETDILEETPEPEESEVPIQTEGIQEKALPSAEDIVNNDIGDDELFCLTVIIYQEVGGEDGEELLRWCIGDVVINQTIWYSATIREVCGYESNWGTLAWTGVAFPSGTDPISSEERILKAYQSAWDVLYGGVDLLPREVVFSAEMIQGAGIFATINTNEGIPVYFCYAWNSAPWSGG